MKKIRIIPRLDIKGPNVVKGIHMEGLRVMGSPTELAARYFEQGADELVYMDIVASLYERNLDFDLVRAVANELFIPLTVGGGIRSLQDINDTLRAGADKVTINTYAVRNPAFLNEAEEALTYDIGEVMLTSVDFDGTRKGYDLDLIGAISPDCPVPLVVYGGAKDAHSMQNAVQRGIVDGLACATILHYNEWTIGYLKRELSAASLPIRT